MIILWGRKVIDKECLECKRYFVKSCDGAEDRGRTEITIENSCSGFLHIETKDILNKLYSIVVELDVREVSNNMSSIGLRDKSWIELCEEAIKLLEKIK